MAQFDDYEYTTRNNNINNMRLKMFKETEVVDWLMQILNHNVLHVKGVVKLFSIFVFLLFLIFCVYVYLEKGRCHGIFRISI